MDVSWSIKKAEYQRNVFQNVVLEKTIESPLDFKEIKPVNPKENQSWIFNGRTDAEAEAPILCSPDMKADALEKEMATHSSVLAWWIPGTEEPGGLRLWGRTESDMTEVT